MERFRGNHLATVDPKGRLKLPSAFGKLVNSANVTQFYITTSDGKKAEIWPLPEWEKVEERLDGISSLNKAVEEYTNLVNYYGQQVEIDGQGRVLLPQLLRKKAQLDGEVTVIGKGNFLAVHNQKMFEKDLPPDGLSEKYRDTVDQIISVKKKIDQALPEGGAHDESK